MREQAERYAELTLSAATALNPYIGYDKAAEIVKDASKSGRTLREVAREHGVDEETLDKALDLRKIAAGSAADLALLLCDHHGASLIVTVGHTASIEEFFDRKRQQSNPKHNLEALTTHFYPHCARNPPIPTMADLLSKRRNRSVARPRQVAMALAKELTSHSLPEIGDAFGGRDHTTVPHACKRIKELLARRIATGVASPASHDQNCCIRVLRVSWSPIGSPGSVSARSVLGNSGAPASETYGGRDLSSQLSTRYLPDSWWNQYTELNQFRILKTQDWSAAPMRLP